MSELARRGVTAEVIIKNICAMTQGNRRVKNKKRKRESLKKGRKKSCAELN